MSLATYIVRRKRSRNYYVRVAIPRDLQERLGTPGQPKREIWKTLNTVVPQEAKFRARPIIEALELEFEKLRGRKPSAATVRLFVGADRHNPLTEPELQHVVWKRYQELLSSNDRFWLATPSNEQQDEIWAELEKDFGEHDIGAFRVLETVLQTVRETVEKDQRERATRFAKLKIDVGRGNTKSVADVAQRVIEDRGLSVQPHTDDYRRLAQALQRAELEAHSRAAERDTGDFTGQPRDRLVQPPTLVLHPSGETILELFDRFKRETAGRVTSDTWGQSRKIVVLFDQFVGGNQHISQLTRRNVRDWKTKLFDWPVKAADMTAFRGMGFLDVIAKNATLKLPTISQKTINRYLSALGGFCTWALANDFLKEDVMRGMYLQFDRSEKTRFPYSADQLATIFSSPLFKSCAGDKREHVAGDIAIRDWRYWLPWIALYTGARLGEIAQLLVADVRQLHGTWIFHVSREGSRSKSVKTKGSERVVPVHSDLIRLGLLDYHAAMKAAGNERLFPHLKPDARGFVAGAASSWFNDYFRAIGVKQDRGVNFHSFRHGIADAFRAAGYVDEQFGMLLGHTKATTTGRYGILPEGILSDRVKMIEAVAFPSIRH